MSWDFKKSLALSVALHTAVGIFIASQPPDPGLEDMELTLKYLGRESPTIERLVITAVEDAKVVEPEPGEPETTEVEPKPQPKPQPAQQEPETTKPKTQKPPKQLKSVVVSPPDSDVKAIQTEVVTETEAEAEAAPQAQDVDNSANYGPATKPTTTQKPTTPTKDARKSSTPTVDRKQLQQAYMRELRPALEKHYFYPKSARRLGQEGRVLVEVVLNAQGEIVGTRVYQSSQIGSLDKAALTTMERIRRFPPPPKDLLREGRLTIVIPIRYQLK